MVSSPICPGSLPHICLRLNPSFLNTLLLFYSPSILLLFLLYSFLKIIFMYPQKDIQGIAKGLENYTNTILSFFIILSTAFQSAKELPSTTNKEINELFITDQNLKFLTIFRKEKSRSQCAYFQITLCGFRIINSWTMGVSWASGLILLKFNKILGFFSCYIWS